MFMNEKEYLFIEATISICEKCLERINAKIILEDGSIFILKNCLKHGIKKELLEKDGQYYLNRKKYDKPGTKCKTQTKIKNGCPFDCGLCPDHEQHTCIGLIEVTNNCDLGCPLCYANSNEGDFLDLKKIEEMMDFYIDSEYGNAEILQISGGEPTTHPQIVEILELASKKGFKYVMLNTNGIRLAEDIEFVKKISNIFSNGFEIYLQFDSFSAEVLKKIRGRDLLKIKNKAIENLAKYNIPITLVATIENGINDNEVGDIVKFGMNQKMIRGINFQPVAFFGRMPRKNITKRSTLTGILNDIEKQTNKMIKTDNFIPLPCDIDRVAISFFKRIKEGKWKSVMDDIEIETYLPNIKNTLTFTMEDIAKDLIKPIFSCKGSGGCMNSMKKMASIIDPKILLQSKQKRVDYVNDNFFRITVTSFVDVYNFDIKSVKKDCVHIITPDLKKMPFSTYNMFYRDKL